MSQKNTIIKVNSFPLGRFSLQSRCVLRFWDLQEGDTEYGKLALLVSDTVPSSFIMNMVLLKGFVS